ncbi:cytochrome c oxidase subunit 4 [Kitasatospora atroaurantiaca]|uniref:cytochrome-c oxidase n=1 Tax=Kitasatospora atroaurantiaca TaxID=285545 RepID=A0A561EK11_9ACTN|nr:cytochrome c oxidase subunit 4 [Kitasatospora atroaurantiaca]TWE15955.1 cytochrome c oxidase subunit IV [Kitasatospora atroaurantiaca]
MKDEAYLFTGVAVFFAVTASIYGVFSNEPAGTTALTVSFLMSTLIALFLWVHYERYGRRLQDRTDVPIMEGAGPLDFFPPHSLYPVVTAVGLTLMALGVVYGLWLFLIGAGVLLPGVVGFVFEYGQRER